MSYRIVPLYGLPTWRLPEHEASWRLGQEAPRSAAVLGSAEAPVDNVAPFVPQPYPGPLQPIDGQPVVQGVGVPWETWTTITSEGKPFMEKFAAGAFARTLRERERGTPVCALVNHGMDNAGHKPLGRLVCWEAADGLRFELAFIGADYARAVAAGAVEGLYSASIRFGTVSDRVARRPGRSTDNPLGLEQRTITEARLVEVSLTARPAYGGTSVNVAAGIAA